MVRNEEAQMGLEIRGSRASRAEAEKSAINANVPKETVRFAQAGLLVQPQRSLDGLTQKNRDYTRLKALAKTNHRKQ